MCILEIIWDTMKWNRTIELKCKGYEDEKYLRHLRKLFKYQPSRWLRDNENCSS